MKEIEKMSPNPVYTTRELISVDMIFREKINEIIEAVNALNKRLPEWEPEHKKCKHEWELSLGKNYWICNHCGESSKPTNLKEPKPSLAKIMADAFLPEDQRSVLDQYGFEDVAKAAKDRVIEEIRLCGDGSTFDIKLRNEIIQRIRSL